MTSGFMWLCLALVAVIAAANLLRLRQTSAMLARKHRRVQLVVRGRPNAIDQDLGRSERVAARLGQIGSLGALLTLVALMGGAVAYRTMPESHRLLSVEVVGGSGSADDSGRDTSETTTTTEVVGPTSSGPSTSPTSAPGSSTTTTNSTAPRVSIEDAAVREGDVNELGQPRYAMFAVQLASSLGHGITLEFETASGTARAGQDYAGEHGSVRIPAGQRTATIRVYVFGDRVREADEYFRVVLFNSPGVALERAVATGTIIDDD